MILLDANRYRGSKVIHSHQAIYPGHVTRTRHARMIPGIVPPSRRMARYYLELCIVIVSPSCGIYSLAVLTNGFIMAPNISPSKTASLVYGPTTEPLWNITLGALIEKQAARYGNRTAVVFPRQNIRRTYNDLLVRSGLVGKALIEQGLEPGDCVGIFAGNCCEYVEVFLGAGAIGCPVVVLNAGYTPTELRDAVLYSGKCKRRKSCVG